MGLFQPITNSNHLPQVGANAENLSLDIKQAVNPREYYELAKDVAAFANASGGVILVGAVEDRPRGIIGKYLPMEQDEAKRVRDAFNQATRDLCSPKPVIDPVLIGCQDKFVIAINVWPFPGQAVGVQIKGGPLAFTFPIRIGVETIFLAAEQLPMLMIPELRRTIILLDAIPTGGQISITDAGRITQEFNLVELRPLENVVVLQTVEGKPGRKPVELFLPIDAVRTVWKVQNARWLMVVEGQIYVVGDSASYHFTG